MKSIVVEIAGLRKSYKDVNALNGIDLKIESGELFGVVGPDGAGKSTLMKILCGVENEDYGLISIFGLDSKQHRDKINKRIGYLSQRFSLYGDLTIDENIEFFARIHGVKTFKKRRDELLELTRLTEFRNRLVDKLSGGMKQKTALTCALIHSPELLILDEPTNGVDAVSRRDFWTILSELILDKITIFISTPYLDETERCSKVALIDKGKVIAEGNPKELKSIVQDNVYEIVCNPSRKALQLLKEKFLNLEVHLFGDKINVFSRNDIDAVINFLRSADISIYSIRKVIPSMENVFIHLIEGEKR